MKKIFFVAVMVFILAITMAACNQNSGGSSGGGGGGSKPPAPVCGNNVCQAGETITSCPADCDPAVCGDTVCEDGEICPVDCDEPTCGDGVCENGETCNVDCDQPVCGDGVCENRETCPADCDVEEEIPNITFTTRFNASNSIQAWTVFGTLWSVTTDPSTWPQAGEGEGNLVTVTMPATEVAYVDGTDYLTGDVFADNYCEGGPFQLADFNFLANNTTHNHCISTSWGGCVNWLPAQNGTGDVETWQGNPITLWDPLNTVLHNGDTYWVPNLYSGEYGDGLVNNSTSFFWENDPWALRWTLLNNWQGGGNYKVCLPPSQYVMGTYGGYTRYVRK